MVCGSSFPEAQVKPQAAQTLRWDGVRGPPASELAWLLSAPRNNSRQRLYRTSGGVCTDGFLSGDVCTKKICFHLHVNGLRCGLAAALLA